MRAVSRASFAAVCVLSSCVATGASGGRDADASVSGIRAEVKELSAALVDLRTDLRAGRDVNNNDTWTLRLLGLGLMLMGLSYPVGKLVWIATVAIRQKAMRLTRGGMVPADVSMMTPFSSPAPNHEAAASQEP